MLISWTNPSLFFGLVEFQTFISRTSDKNKQVLNRVLNKRRTSDSIIFRIYWNSIYRWTLAIPAMDWILFHLTKKFGSSRVALYCEKNILYKFWVRHKKLATARPLELKTGLVSPFLQRPNCNKSSMWILFYTSGPV